MLTVDNIFSNTVVTIKVPIGTLLIIFLTNITYLNLNNLFSDCILYIDVKF